MKLEIYSEYRDDAERRCNIAATIQTTLTTQQLKRISRRGEMSVSKGVALMSAGRGGDHKHAEYYVRRLVRLIRFSEVTGLLPSAAGGKTWDDRHSCDGSIGRPFDHDMTWRAPNGAVVYTNEPYHLEAFAEWVTRTGWHHVEVPQAHALYEMGAFMVITTPDADVDLDGMLAAWVATK